MIPDIFSPLHQIGNPSIVVVNVTQSVTPQPRAFAGQAFMLVGVGLITGAVMSIIEALVGGER